MANLPVYATAYDMWQLALPPNTLFQDQGIEPGTWSNVVKVGTGTGSMDLSLVSNPRSAFSVIVRCVLGGELNIYGNLNPGPFPKFIISLDAGGTFSHPIEAASNGNLAYQKGGFTLVFQNGTVSPSFVINDTYSFTTTQSPDIDRALNTASRFADGLLKNTYALPLSEWEDDIRLPICQIARWHLIERRGLDDGQDFKIYYQSYLDACDYLKEVAKGYIQATVKEKGDGFVFSQWDVARCPYRTDWRF